MTAPTESVAIVEETQHVEPGDHDLFAHYVNTKIWDLTEAMVNGTPVQALCGKQWVPTRDALRYPVCPTCKEILDMIHPPEG